MRKIGLIFTVLTITCLFIQELDARAKGVLQLSMLLDKKEYKLGEPIYINFRLKNTSTKPVYINKRFYLGSEESKPGDREVFLRITGPTGEKLPCKFSYDTGFPKTDYFVILKPKEEFTTERKKNLNAYFDLKDIGTYKIIAVYQNVYGPEIGIKAFSKRIESKPVYIKIVE
jgi:hypothetical protein